MKALTRDEFGKQVFARDHKTCVIPGCGRPAADPHHIMERRLFTDGDPIPWGYHINNGASLCEAHHKHAEENFFPPQALRRWLKIEEVILPAVCLPGKLYDKWGNEIASVSETHVKYPKTPYLPFSPGYAHGDRYISLSDLINKPLAITIKRDGSCVVLGRDLCAARNGTEARHASFNLLKQRHAGFRMQIPEHTLLYGEWLYAKHSIHYTGKTALRDFLEIFAVYDQKDQLFLSQDEVARICKSINLLMVEAISYATYDTEWALVNGLNAAGTKAVAQGQEGIVVKSVYPFHYTQFALNTAKFVREGHVQTDEHWSQQKITPNEVK